MKIEASDNNDFYMESHNHCDQWWRSYPAFNDDTKSIRTANPNWNQWIADTNRLLVAASIMERNLFAVLLPFNSLAMVNSVKIDTHKNCRISNAGGVTTPQSIFTFSVTIQLTMEKYFPFMKCFFIWYFAFRISTFVYKHTFTCCVDASTRSSLVLLAFDARIFHQYMKYINVSESYIWYVINVNLICAFVCKWRWWWEQR